MILLKDIIVTIDCGTLLDGNSDHVAHARTYKKSDLLLLSIQSNVLNRSTNRDGSLRAQLVMSYQLV